MPLRALTSSVLACLAAGTLVLAPAAPAATGGTEAAGGASPAPAPALPKSGSAPASRGPNTLQPPVGALVRQLVQLHGELTRSAARRRVVVQLLDPKHGWSVVARSTTDARGAFTASWRPQREGRFRVRALQPGTASASSVAPSVVLEILKPVRATWFGPDPNPAHEQHTACGQVLTSQLLGVAHRTLPCGTLVDIAYHGRSISVPVVDRGPFVRGVTLDLTQATAQALGFDGSAYVGALFLKR